MKKAGDQTLKGVKLGIGSLHKHIVGTDIEGTAKTIQIGLNISILIHIILLHRSS